MPDEKKIPKKIIEHSDKIRAEVKVEITSEEFLEKSEQFQKKIGFISPQDLQRHFNI